ncbi:MAG TPA: hypothetical protein VIJ30_10190, partial [Candidatus Dormibacteraeota bacterium]
MTPEERELRRALESRSAEVTPEFRARLSSALAEGKSASNFVPALAAVAAVVLVFATVGVLLLARQARNQPPPVAATTPSAQPTPTPTPSAQPTPTPTVARGVLIGPPSRIALPATSQLSAPSSNALWALVVSEYLYRSTDRGKTWVQRPMLPAFYGAVSPQEMAFASSLEGWVTEGGPRPGSSSECSAFTASVWHTTDAGTTWQLLPPTGIPDSRCKSGFTFVDSSRGFVGAWDQSHAPVIYRTLDSGKTWSASQPLPTPPGFKTVCVGCIGMQTGPVRAFGSTLLVSAWQLGPPGTQYVFRSTDGGATWAYVAAAPGQDGNVDFVMASRWLKLIGPGQSKETTDAGATWHAYASDYSQAAPIAADFVFATPTVGYGTVRGGISRTVDGGLHWTQIHTP